jgi:hypothetical protein
VSPELKLGAGPNEKGNKEICGLLFDICPYSSLDDRHDGGNMVLL